MASHTIEIGSYIFDGPLMTYDYRRKAAWDTEHGYIKYVEVWVEVRQAEVASTPATVMSGVVTASALVGTAPETVTVKLDGSAIITIDSSTAFVGPIVSEFETEDDEGAGESHQRYRILLYARVPPGADSTRDTTAYDVKSWVQTEKNADGDVIKQIWHAEAKGKTGEEALEVIRPYKPANRRVTEVMRIAREEAFAVAEWVWSRQQRSEGIVEWTCEVSTIDRTTEYILGKQVGPSGTRVPPILHRARRGVKEIRVRGRIVSYDRASCVVPFQHFSDSSEMVRIRHLEQTMAEPAIADPGLGTYYITYEEVWWSSVDSPVIPDPNHTNEHNVIQVDTPPDKGPIVSDQG